MKAGLYFDSNESEGVAGSIREVLRCAAVV